MTENIRSPAENIRSLTESLGSVAIINALLFERQYEYLMFSQP